MPLIICYAKLNFHFSDLRSLLPRRDTYVLIDSHQLTSFSLFNFQGEIKCSDGEVDGLGVVTPDLTEEVQN